MNGPSGSLEGWPEAGTEECEWRKTGKGESTQQEHWMWRRKQGENLKLRTGSHEWAGERQTFFGCSENSTECGKQRVI